jgi:hypothetical protein
LAVSGSQSVSLSGGSGNYTVSSNSNTTVVSTNLSGNTLTVTGLATGGATITVCDASNASTCGTLSVTVGGSSSSGLTFSQNNISLAAGATLTVNISGGNGVYEVSSNSNSSAVSVGMSGGNGIVVDASNAGSATITVCDTSNTNTCGTLYVTVTGSTSSSNQGVTFSVPNPTLAVGQTLDVQLSGGATTYVVLWNQNDNVVQASMAGESTLALTGLSSGTDSLTICATLGNCSPLSVTVTGSSTTSPTPTTTNTNTTQTTQPSTAVANTLLLSEIQTVQTALTQALTQIQSIQTEINQLEAQVAAGSGSGITASASVPSGTSAFTELLSVGSEDAQVTALQNRLTALGYYSGPVTGFYGSLTESAVMKYQTAHGIETTGEVGPSTRAALNAGD